MSQLSSPARPMRRVCIVGASGKLGRYMVEQCLDRGYEVVGVCRAQSVGKLAHVADRIRIVPGMTNDRVVIEAAVAGCDGVLVVLAPWGIQQYSSGTAQAVMDFAEPGARLIFSCGWHITKDGGDHYSLAFRLMVAVFAFLGRITRFAELSDQVKACRRIFASDTAWTVVRGSDLEEGPAEGLPVWAERVHDPKVARNKMRRVDFAHFMVHALTDLSLVHTAPAITGRGPAALAAK